MKWIGIPLVAIIGLAQPQNGTVARPEFEVASIKLSQPQPEGRTSTTMSVYAASEGRNGSLKYLYVSLKEVLGQAYEVQQYQVAGGPEWIDSQRFDIAAVIPAGSARDQIPSMLQSLLLDRFKLALHREMKELPVYALVIGKNGPKLKPAESVTGISSNSNRVRWQVNAQTSMLKFAEFLSLRLDRPVLDATDLSGAFSFALDSASDTVEPQGTKDAASGPSMFTAVQEQLGLKLEARKGPVEILVIDQAEKPSEN